MRSRLEESPLSTSLDWFRYDDVGWDETGLSYVSLLLRYGPDLDECWGATDRLRTAYGTSRIRDAFPELEGDIRQNPRPVANNEAFLACKKLIADERRRRSCGEAEGGPAAPVARGPRARQKSSTP